ncbi:MAG TPA: mechanosensitive ion channel family protein [Nitrospirota bacterium]|nr:mechanosensitive ion channel family protein [Nitrospirota bacterium]
MAGVYQITISILIIAGIAAVLLLCKKIFFNVLRKLVRDTALQIEEFFEKGLQVPLSLLFIVLAVYIGLRLADIPQEYVPSIVTGMYLSLILTVTMGLSNVSDRALDFFLKKSGMPISVTGLLLGVTKASIYGIGILIALNYLGLSIAPIITALGVGGLAMALALQDTLSNLFAGMHILAEQSIRVGDFIRLETGQEGYIVDIGWRTTRIRMMSNNMVIVPNSKLSQSVVTNYYLPERQVVIQLPISVSVDTDPSLVERLLLDEVNKASLDIPGICKETPPSVLLVPGFGASSLDFTLFCRVKDIVDQQRVLHELRKRIITRFKKDGVDIPFPSQTLYVKEISTGKKPTRKKM